MKVSRVWMRSKCEFINNQNYTLLSLLKTINLFIVKLSKRKWFCEKTTNWATFRLATCGKGKTSTLSIVAKIYNFFSKIKPQFEIFKFFCFVRSFVNFSVELRVLTFDILGVLQFLQASRHFLFELCFQLCVLGVCSRKLFLQVSLPILQLLNCFLHAVQVSFGVLQFVLSVQFKLQSETFKGLEIGRILTSQNLGTDADIHPSAIFLSPKNSVQSRKLVQQSCSNPYWLHRTRLHNDFLSLGLVTFFSQSDVGIKTFMFSRALRILTRFVVKFFFDWSIESLCL